MSLDEQIEGNGQIGIDTRLEDYVPILPARAKGVFRRLGIETVGQLVERTPKEILSLRNSGVNTLRAIRGFLAGGGYSLRGDADLSNADMETYSLKARAVERVRDLAAEGKSRTEIARELGCSYENICVLIQSVGIAVEDLRGGHNKKIDDKLAERLIRRGLSLGQLADRLGVTGEAARTHINRQGLHDDWIKSREFYKNKDKLAEKERVDVISSLVGVIQDWNYGRVNWEERKAIEYLAPRLNLVLARGKVDFDSLVKLFRTYREANKRGKKLSLDEFGKSTGIHWAHISRVLKRVGLEPMYGARERIPPLTREQVKLIVKAVTRTDLFYEDIAYFMGLPGRHNIACRPEIKGLLPKYYRGGLDSIALGIGGPKQITYRLAFQVYEAKDAGYFKDFTKEEVAGLLDTRVEVVERVLAKRKEYEPRIMKALDVVFGRKP